MFRMIWRERKTKEGRVFFENLSERFFFGNHSEAVLF
jgi:hypothetical protein